jgi:hypothetical protein
MISFRFAAMALLLACVTAPALAQEQSYSDGIVDDWTHHHVIFANPGTLEEAMKKGKYQDWLRIVNDPRYQMQQVRRYGALTSRPITAETTGRTTTSSASLPGESGTARIITQAPSFTGTTTEVTNLPGMPRPEPPYFNPRITKTRRAALHTDWTVQILGGSGGPQYLNVYPAKYTFSPVGSPSCANDFVVFVTGGAGNYTQAANIFGFNNLYAGTCTGVPTTMFAYFLGPAVQNSTSGNVQNSPVLSLDGTKVAFIESITNGSIFHVLTMDKRGNSGCPNAPCNGSSFNNPAVPCTVNGVQSCTTNNAVDTKMTMSGNVSVTLSTPFVDYTGDIAYVGDDVGKLHKFTGVFTGTPTEVKTSAWPATVASGVILTAPVYDSGSSQNIFVGGASNGTLYCVTTAGAACSPASSIAVGTPVTGTFSMIDPPVVDSTIEKVFAEANTTTNAVLTETTTSFGAPIKLASEGPSGTDLYSPVFDNTYYTSGGTGNMYFCADLTNPSAATPELYQTPVTNGTVGTPKAVFQLVNTGNTGSSVDCSPLAEFYNSTTSIDYLFLSVKEHGFNTGTPNCADNTCLMSFALPQTSPYTFPTSAKSTMPGGSLGPKGTSGVIVDNAAATTGASQIYFGNLQNNNATQVSQSALQ